MASLRLGVGMKNAPVAGRPITGSGHEPADPGAPRGTGAPGSSGLGPGLMQSRPLARGWPRPRSMPVQTRGGRPSALR